MTTYKKNAKLEKEKVKVKQDDEDGCPFTLDQIKMMKAILDSFTGALRIHIDPMAKNNPALREAFNVVFQFKEDTHQAALNTIKKYELKEKRKVKK